MVLLYVSYLTVPFSYYYRDNSNYEGIKGAYQLKKFQHLDGVWLILAYTLTPASKNESKLIQETLNKTYSRQETKNFVGLKLEHYKKRL